jgi:4-carboxymuconolactone decarboxylase
MSEDLAQLGQEVRAKLWGEAQLGAAERFLGEFDAAFATYLNEQLFGAVWNRPGLPIKTRSLITVAVLLALGKDQEARLHMRGALNLGISQEELKEIVVHLAHYAGVPTAMEGIRALREVSAPPVAK